MRNSSGNRSKGGDAFREWLSDRLRYFILLFAFLIAVAAITIVSRFLDQRLNLNNRNFQDPGSTSAVVSDKETEEPIVILSSGGETPETAQEESSEPAAEKPAETVTEKQTEKATEKQTEKVTEKQTEKATEKQTEKATEKQTEAVTEKQTEAVTEKQTEAVTEKQTEAVTEKQTEAITEKQTEAVTEKQTEAATEKQTEAVTEKQTEAATEKQTEAVTEKQTEKVTEKQTEKATEKQPETAAEKQTEKAAEKQPETAAEKQTEKAAEKQPETVAEKQTEAVAEETLEAAEEKESETPSKKTGMITTSSTEKTVHASSDSKKPVTSATLAGVGAQEQETETESSVKTGTITVTGTSAANRGPVLVSGGSSTSGNRASVTNIDTGTTIGTYRRVADTGTATETVPAGSTNADSDYSGGIVESGDSSQSDSWSEVQNVAEPPAPEPEYRTVSSACNLRSYPDYGDNVIGTLQAGETVLFYGLEEGWYKVEYYGTIGYIGPKFLQ